MDWEKMQPQVDWRQTYLWSPFVTTKIAGVEQGLSQSYEFHPHITEPKQMHCLIVWKAILILRLKTTG